MKKGEEKEAEIEIDWCSMLGTLAGTMFGNESFAESVSEASQLQQIQAKQ